MTQSLADIIVHMVFSTKERLPLIKSAIEEELYKYISGLCLNLECPDIKINGVEDHIHILVQLGRTITVSNLISEMKSNSSRWIKSKSLDYKDFAWQGGFGAISVSRYNLDSAKEYLSKQKEHHKAVSFRDELRALLKKAQITYDEKYLWN